MEDLSFKSANVEITANTAADMANCWHRFRARVGDKADTYCDYRSTLPGNLELALYSDRFALHPVGEPDSREWVNQAPVFYETAPFLRHRGDRYYRKQQSGSLNRCLSNMDLQFSPSR